MAVSVDTNMTMRLCLVILIFVISLLLVQARDLSSSSEEDGIYWHDLTVASHSTGDVLLYPSTGQVAKGHICGIIGSSGAGKSTFLAALGGTTSQHARLELGGRVWWQEQDHSSILNIR